MSIADRKRSPFGPFYGVPAEVIAELCGIPLRVAVAYKDGTSLPPSPVLRLVQLYVERRILGPEFAGWSVCGAELVDPEGHRTTQAQLRGYSFVWQFARELARSDPSAVQELDRIASIASKRIQKSRTGEIESTEQVLYFGRLAAMNVAP